MARLQSDLILSLQDRVSGPARVIDQNLDNLRRQQMRSQEMFNRHRNAMLGTAAAAYVMARAISVPVQASIAFSTQLEDIRQKADLSTEAIERLGRASRVVGKETAQGASSIAGAIDSMVGAGAVTPEQALEISTPLGKASTAYGADPTEMAEASSALVLQLDIQADKMEHAYDIMAVAGKRGAFELKNMATEFPGVLAQANALGVTGEKGLASVAAWLQIAKRGTATGAEAATNYTDFMNKITSTEAIKNFKGFGVDIQAELKRAVESGVDPVEHAVGIINKLLKGDQSRIGELFNDKQVKQFLLQAMKGVEEYRSIRDEAFAADGTVERDFQDRLLTPAGAIARFESSIENLNIAVGNSLVPALADFASSVTPMIDGVASFVDANGQLVAAVVEITAALVGLRLLAAAGGMGGALLGMGGGAVAGGAAGGAAAGAGLAGGAAGAVGIAAAGKAFLGTAFGKMAGMLAIYETAKVANSMGVGEGFGGDKTWDHNVVHSLDPVLAKMLYEGYNPLPAVGAKLAGYGDKTLTGGAESEEMAAIRQMLAENDSGMSPLHPIELTALRQELAALEVDAAAAGNAAGASLQAGITAQVPAAAASMGALMERLRVIAASGVTIPMRTIGPTVSPVVTRAAIAGARASGGPVRGGSTYEINERGTEYFTPGVNGFVHKAGSFQPPGMPSFGGRGGAPAYNGPASVTFGDIILQNPTDASPQQIASALGDIVTNRLRASHSNGSM